MVVQQLIILDGRAYVEVNLRLRAPQLTGMTDVCQRVHNRTVLGDLDLSSTPQGAQAAKESVPQEMEPTDAVERSAVCEGVFLVLHIHRDHNLCSHGSHDVDRQVVTVTTVNQKITIIIHWGEQANNCHGGLHVFVQATPRLHLHVGRGDVCRHAKVREPQVLDVRARSKRELQGHGEVAAREQREHRECQVADEIPDRPNRRGEEGDLRHHAFDRQRLSERCSHECSLACSTNFVDWNALLVECLDYTQVRQSTAATSTKHQSHGAV
mmetsp:Transcript_35034/g.79894  ORF Transcript_35034/g.79894 Transcript_35034/m.79894 type:complete len:268 (+) Transcript_35034:277-1080(+)